MARLSLAGCNKVVYLLEVRLPILVLTELSVTQLH